MGIEIALKNGKNRVFIGLVAIKFFYIFRRLAPFHRKINLCLDILWLLVSFVNYLKACLVAKFR